MDTVSTMEDTLLKAVYLISCGPGRQAGSGMLKSKKNENTFEKINCFMEKRFPLAKLAKAVGLHYSIVGMYLIEEANYYFFTLYL